MAELRAAVNQAKKNDTAVERKSVEFRRNGQPRSVNISAEPLGSATENRQYLSVFERALPSASMPGKVGGKFRISGLIAKKENAQLRRKLAEAEEHLRSPVESKEASDQEYQSANEELLSANEELQSTNEELETSKEELQSANEELNTVNDELHNRNIQLDRANSDLNNLLTSTSLPVVMVDRGLRIGRLTAASAKVFKIVPSDIGRPISDIRSDVNVPNLDELIAGVIETPVDQANCFAWIPSFFIRERRVVRFMPRRAAAPSAPPTRPLHTVSACTISSRCFLAYSSATLLVPLCDFVAC